MTLAKTESATRGMGGLPLVEVPHPVGTIPTDALKKWRKAPSSRLLLG